jgi:hypothetical protein
MGAENTWLGADALLETWPVGCAYPVEFESDDEPQAVGDTGSSGSLQPKTPECPPTDLQLAAGGLTTPNKVADSPGTETSPTVEVIPASAASAASASAASAGTAAEPLANPYLGHRATDQLADDEAYAKKMVSEA